MNRQQKSPAGTGLLRGDDHAGGAVVYPHCITKPGAILAGMLATARRRRHGERDARIEAALLALLWRWEQL